MDFPITPPDFLIDLVGKQSAETITKLVLAFLVLLLTFIITRRLLKLLLSNLLRVTKRTNTNYDERLVRAIDPPLRLLLTVVGVWVALVILELSPNTIEIIEQTASSLVAVSIFWGIYRIVDVVADGIVLLSGRTRHIERDLVHFGQQVVKALVIVVAFAVIMGQFGFNLNGLLAGLGLGGLAVALAAQDALSNLIGYFVIVGDSPFGVGDYIVSESGAGTVEHVGFRSTRLRQLDASLVVIPNAKLTEGSITNWTRISRRRLDMNVGLTYSSSPGQILAVVQSVREMLVNHERVIKDTVFVEFFNFGESSLDIRVICYIDEPSWNDFHRIKADMYLRMMTLVEKHGVEIAFPTRTVVLQRSLPVPAVVEPLEPIFPQPPESPHDPILDLEQPDDGK